MFVKKKITTRVSSCHQTLKKQKYNFLMVTTDKVFVCFAYSCGLYVSAKRTPSHHHIHRYILVENTANSLITDVKLINQPFLVIIDNQSAVSVYFSQHFHVGWSPHFSQPADALTIDT
jgi:hypothetical protein